MDHERRIARSEAQVENLQSDANAIHHAIEKLGEHTDRRFAEQREHIDKGLAGLREHIDKGLAEQREHTDKEIAELRKHTDKGFAESRKEFRWVVGLVLLNTSMIIGLAGRVFEVY